jgi:hypothetical protein
MWREGSKRNPSRDHDRKRDNRSSNLKKRKPELAKSKSPNPKKSFSIGPKIMENELSKGVDIAEPKELLKACERHPQLKVADTQVVFKKNIVLKDVSIRGKGPAEDMIYAGCKGIHVNVRRGSSFVLFKDSQQVTCARRGLRKFYDLYPEYLEYNLGNLTTLDGKIGVKEPAENKSIHKKIFSNLKELLDLGSETVTLIETNKANGENAQISWVPELEVWSIGSKNVTMLLRTSDDVSLYIGDRFHYAELIAREWFLILKRLKDDKIAAIKDCLASNTLVGEYVGNPSYQHLVKYEKQGFLFYALVPKQSTAEAVNPKEAFEKIKALGLQSVSFKEHGGIKTWVELNTKLKELYKAVRESTIETKEEGLVIYIVKRGADGQETLVSLSKLKTLEYVIFRKLREKLRALTEKKLTREQIETKFQEEVKTIIGMNTTPRELSFYFDVAKRALDFAQTVEDLSLIFGHFVTFLSIVVYCSINTVPISMGFFEKSVTQELLATPWSKYSALKSKLKVSDTYTPKIPRTIVFIPLTIPGMGKSHLYKDVVKSYCEENGLTVRLVSSDQIRHAEMGRLRQKEANLTENVLFAKSREPADHAFSKLLIHYLKERSNEDKIIYIDKNHPPNAIKKTIELIHAHKPANSDVRLLALMPKSKPGPTLTIGDKEVSYPFSLELCLNCLVTVQTRKEHETLNGTGVDSASVVIMFYNMFRDFKFDGTLLKDLGFNGGISMDFFGEHTYEKDVIDKLQEILSKLPKAGDKPRDIHLLDQLLGLMQDYFLKNSLNRPSKDTQTKCIANVLKNLPAERPAPPPSILTKLHPAQNLKLTADLSKPSLPNLNNQYWQEVIKGNDARAKSYETHPPASTVSKKEFKPKKNPDYLSIMCKVDEKQRVQNMIRYALSKIHALHSDSQINEDLTEFTQDTLSTWKSPADGYHITTCFVGADKTVLASEPFKTFEEGVHFPFRIRHLVYVPGMVVTGIVYLDRGLVKVANKFPHMTLANKNLPPHGSNEVLETMFGGVFNPKYKEGLRFGNDKISTLNITLQGVSCIAYLFEFPQEIYFDGETKAVFH